MLLGTRMYVWKFWVLKPITLTRVHWVGHWPSEGRAACETWLQHKTPPCPINAEKRCLSNHQGLTKVGHHFADDSSKYNFLNEHHCTSVQISLKFVPKGSTDNNSRLVLLSGDKRLRLDPDIWHAYDVTKPQWVNRQVPVPLYTELRSITFWGPFYKYGIILIPSWISNHMSSKVWDETIYPFPNFNGCTARPHDTSELQD